MALTISGLTSSDPRVRLFIVEVFADSGLTTLVDVQSAPALANPATGGTIMQGYMAFPNLQQNTTYYCLPRTTDTISGIITNGTVFSVVAPPTEIPAAHAASVDVLTNADKIALIAQYNAELATQTKLDTTANSLSLSHSAYDTAITQINTTLVNAGAPSNWATVWPDGKTFGPSTGIQTALANDWASIASARAGLVASISAANAAAAQATAISVAAADATSKMNAAISASHSVVVVSSLPTLPDSTYPSGIMVWNTGDGQLYRSTGSTWVVLAVAGSSITAGTITAGQIAAGAIGADQIAANSIAASKLIVTDTSNICMNPSGESGLGTDGWTAGVTTSTPGDVLAGLPSGTVFLGQTNRDGFYGPPFPVAVGDAYRLSCQAKSGTATVGFTIGLVFYSAPGVVLAYVGIGSYLSPGSSVQSLSGRVTVPSGALYGQIWTQINGTPGSTGSWYFRNFICNKATNGSLLVDGTVTASKIAAGAITADMITTGVLDASAVSVTNLNASNITTGTLSATKVVFSDGSDLTTASRVTTSSYNGITSDPSMTLATFSGIPEMTATLTSSGTSDVFLIMFRSNFVAGLNSFVQAQIYVDGVAQAGTVAGCHSLNGSSVQLLSIDNSITGLSAGSHTIAVYGQTNGATSDHWYSTWRNLTIQHVK